MLQSALPLPESHLKLAGKHSESMAYGSSFDFRPNGMFIYTQCPVPEFAPYRRSGIFVFGLWRVLPSQQEIECIGIQTAHGFSMTQSEPDIPPFEPFDASDTTVAFGSLNYSRRFQILPGDFLSSNRRILLRDDHPLLPETLMAIWDPQDLPIVSAINLQLSKKDVETLLEHQCHVTCFPFRLTYTSSNCWTEHELRHALFQQFPTIAKQWVTAAMKLLKKEYPRVTSSQLEEIIRKNHGGLAQIRKQLGPSDVLLDQQALGIRQKLKALGLNLAASRPADQIIYNHVTPSASSHAQPNEVDIVPIIKELVLAEQIPLSHWYRFMRESNQQGRITIEDFSDGELARLVRGFYLRGKLPN